jgi:plastocyanin
MAGMSRRQMLKFALTGAAITPILSACASVAADERFLIEMTQGNRFAPSGLTVPLGATVVWRNAGITRHTATCDPALVEELTHVSLPPGAAPWGSTDLYTGQTWQRTFTTPGTYLYFCRYHETEGMVATLTVLADQTTGEGT